ncbi:tetratricopeptide repeat protein [Kitasatospora sp. MBT63]|uniref:tetratricopeptide repeat protein n=1 Tax=Kitasatospora sp. MBT63 TaxID=1444768 RepID=UPI000539D689|nr:tetratricopeptide repeat protein [Kitasatospora sp. MBT63]
MIGVGDFDFGSLPGTAFPVLATTAWLAPDRIPVELLPSTPDRDADLAALVRAGLVTRGPDGTCSVAPRVQQKFRRFLGERWQFTAIAGIAGYLGDPGAPGATARCITLAPHLSAWVGYTRAEDHGTNIVRLIERMLDLLFESGLWRAALPLCERVNEVTELRFPPGSTASRLSRSRLAHACREVGQYQRATRIWEGLIAVQVEISGAGHPLVSDLETGLGETLLESGDHRRAMEVVERIVADRTASLGATHRDTLSARNNIGVIHEWAGRRDEAARVWAALLPEFESALGPDDPDTVLVRTRLKSAQGAQGGPAIEPEEPEQARSVEELTGEVVFDELGRWHALLLADEDPEVDSEAVEPEVRQLLERGEAALGAGHPAVVATRRLLAIVHFRQERWDDAVEAARETLDAADRYLGRSDDRTKKSVALLMQALVLAGHFDALEPLLEERLEDVIELLGFGDPLVRALAARRALDDLKQPRLW